MVRHAMLFMIGATLMAAGPAFGQMELDSYFTGDDSPKVDALLDEWVDEEGKELIPFMPLGSEDRVGGDGAMEGPEDVGAEFAIAHNRNAFFAVFKLVDQRLIRTKKLETAEDHVEIWFAAGEGKDVKLAGLGIYADPSKHKGPVEFRWIKPGSPRSGGKVAGAVGAVRGDEMEYTIEVSVPWKAFPKPIASRKGLRAAIFVVDGDMAAHMEKKNILGTAPISVLEDPEVMPFLLQGDLGSGLSSFAESMGLPANEQPRFNETVDLAGNKAREDVMVVGKYLVAQGGSIDPGAYVYTALPVDSSDQVTKMKPMDLVGDKRLELVLEFREEQGVATRKWVEIYRVNGDMLFQKIFSAALEVDTGAVRISNSYKFVKGPGKTRAIEVKAGAVKGVTEETIGNNVPEEDGNFMVLPWNKPAKVKYIFKDEIYQF